MLIVPSQVNEPLHPAYVSQTIQEATALPNRLALLVEAYASHFNFRIRVPDHPPEYFSQVSECAFNYTSFYEIAETHFQTNATLYLACLVTEDKTSNLVRLSDLKTWYEIKRWKGTAFRNPSTYSLCTSIRSLEFNQFGRCLKSIDFYSMQAFKKGNRWIAKNQQVMNALFGYDQEPLENFSVDRLVKAFTKVLQDPAMSTCVDWIKVNAFFTDKAYWRCVLSITDKLTEEASNCQTTCAEFFECLGNFNSCMSERSENEDEAFDYAQSATDYFIRSLQLGNPSIEIVEKIIYLHTPDNLAYIVSNFNNKLIKDFSPIHACVLGQYYLFMDECEAAYNMFKHVLSFDPECRLAQIKLEEVKKYLDIPVEPRVKRRRSI